jgi:hypothetical protein
MIAFYRRAVFLPVAIPIGAALVSLLFSGAHVPAHGQLYSFLDTLQFIAIAGVVGLIPHAIYVAAVLSLIQPTSGPQMRRLSWLAPSMIALPFALVVAVVLPVSPPGLVARVRAFAYWGLLALCVGYAYVLLIEVALLLGRKMRWVSMTGERHESL